MASELKFLYVPRKDAVKRAEIGLYNDACQDRTVTLTDKCDSTVSHGWSIGQRMLKLSIA